MGQQEQEQIFPHDEQQKQQEQLFPHDEQQEQLFTTEAAYPSFLHGELET